MEFSIMKNFMNSLTAWRIPGNSVSVYFQNREVFTYSSGYADLETKIPMTAETPIYIYSCSKMATVTAALQLYEQGRFLMTDPLYEYIPEYRNMIVKSADGNVKKAENHITIRDLFCMTAGLDYDISSPAIDKARQITGGGMDTLTVAKCLAEQPLVFEPGTRWKYSLCHDVLGALVEVVAGMKFRDYVTEKIFKPISMEKSFYHVSEDIKSKMAKQYFYVENDIRFDVIKQQREGGKTAGRTEKTDGRNEFILGDEYDSGGAGIITTVNDYAKFVNALANWGAGANGERILSKGTVELLRTNQLSGKPLDDFNWRQLAGYGYGLGVRTMIDRVKSGSNGSYGEFGWGGAAGASAYVDSDLGLSAFYSHHMLNPQEPYYQPRLRNALYSCVGL
ncbi:serine hydrolase [Clostridia bacterium]|nr:serine hydrolase [Clostridia bacterium]